MLMMLAPLALFGKTLQLLMLMMLVPRGVFRQKVGAADAHDAGSPRRELLMLMLLAPHGVFRQKVGAADAHDAGFPRRFSAKGWSC